MTRRIKANNNLKIEIYAIKKYLATCWNYRFYLCKNCRFGCV